MKYSSYNVITRKSMFTLQKALGLKTSASRKLFSKKALVLINSQLVV